MPMYRFQMRPRHAGRDAQPAGDLVRYLQREGEFAPKEVTRDAEVDYLTRTSLDTAEHDDLVGAPVVGNLPAWAHNDAGFFFVTASNQERANGQYAVALQIALPRELTHAQHMALAQDFVEAVMPDKPYLLVKHEPVKEGQAQPHLHILLSPRTTDTIARDAATHFRRWNADHPERGGTQKDRFWNQRQAPARLREAFSDLANYHLERAGVGERIDPRSLRKQGVTRERISWHNRVALDDATKAREQANAAAAWERRKAYKQLGQAQAIPREEFVLLVRQWTRDITPGQSLEPATPEQYQAYAHGLARQAAHLERAIRTLEAEQRLLARLTERDTGPRRGRLHVQLYEEDGYGR